MLMMQLVGKRCRIHVLLYGKHLYYDALITSADDLVCFEDKFGDKYCFRKKDILEVSPLDRRKGGGVV